MTDDELEDNVMMLMAECFQRLFARDGSRQHLENFMAGQTVFVVSRAEVAVVSPPPPNIITDLGTAN